MLKITNSLERKILGILDYRHWYKVKMDAIGCYASEGDTSIILAPKCCSWSQVVDKALKKLFRAGYIKRTKDHRFKPPKTFEHMYQISEKGTKALRAIRAAEKKRRKRMSDRCKDICQEENKVETCSRCGVLYVDGECPYCGVIY